MSVKRNVIAAGRNRSSVGKLSYGIMLCFLCSMLNICLNHLYLFPGEPISTTIEIVIAYCKSNLTWIEKDVIQDTLEEFGQASFYFTIMSKCGREEDIPDFGKNPAVEKVDIISIDNVGGCEYAFAKYLDDYYMQGRQKKKGFWFKTDLKSSTSNNVVLFMEDSPRSEEQLAGDKYLFSYHRSVPELIRISSEEGDVACGQATNENISNYHDTKTLYKFHIKQYTRRNNQEPSAEGIEHQFNPHNYKNLRDFHSKALKWEFPRQDYTRVCYGGVFSVPQRRLVSLFKDKTFTRVIKSMKAAVSESKMSIAEHYVERTWAGLLSKPLTDEDTRSLKSIVNGVVKLQQYVYGALFIGKDKNLYPKNYFGKYANSTR